MNNAKSWKDWHIPYSQEQISLREAVQSLKTVGESPANIPIMVQLVENPKFAVPGLNLFPGRVTLEQHDSIHIILGRGLLPKDEAFAIGFTMGSTNNVSTAEETMFSLISKHFYPPEYRFNDDDLRVFRDAVKLGAISACMALDTVDFDRFMDRSLAEIRRALGIESELIRAYYSIEKKRFPNSVESQRLLD